LAVQQHEIDSAGELRYPVLNHSCPQPNRR
jgi:hypothetical protein